MKVTAVILAVLGAAAIAAGVALIYPPAGAIAAGVELIGAGYVVGYLGARRETA